MHEYSIAQGIRKWTWLIVMVIALVLSLAYMGLVKVCPRLELPSILESPSLLGTFGALMFVYDKWLWKKFCFGVRLSPVPDYSGTWKGVIKSCHNGGIEIECTLTIKQTWSEIVCKLTTDSSCSYSTAASICTKEGPNEGLVWRYINTPRNDCRPDMQMHHGVTKAKMNIKGELECDYYNCSRERNTCGTITFHRV